MDLHTPWQATPGRRRAAALLVAGCICLIFVGPRFFFPDDCSRCNCRRVAAVRSDAGAGDVGAGGGGGGTAAPAEGPEENPNSALLAAQAGSPGPEADQPHLRGLNWEEINKLIQAPAQRHGVQQKAGPPALLPLLLDHMTDSSRELWGLPRNPYSPEMLGWLNRMARRNMSGGGRGGGRGSGGGSSDELRSPIPSCHYRIDHQYRLIYAKMTKTGGTSMVNTLGFKATPTTCSVSPKLCLAGCKGRQTCLEYTTDQEELEKHWMDYTVFAVSRNPWSRAVSSWRFIGDETIQPGCQISFTDFAATPSTYAALCVDRPECCTKPLGWVLMHLEPQAPCILAEGGRPAVDFIGREEHLEEDLEELAALINSRQPKGTAALQLGPVPRLKEGTSSSDPATKQRRYAELYANNSGLADVYRYYRQDFDLLQLPGEGPEAG